MDRRFMSDNEHGVEEDQPGIHPNVLNEYYGADQPDWATLMAFTDAGNPQEEIEVNARIAEDQANDIRHPGANVPPESSPFTTVQESIFFDALNETVRLNIMPNGYGVAQQEWPRELPFDICWPQAVKWVQGLDCMTQLMVELDL
ncbi:hypothetical protein L208DRAFT_1380694 [Tricholoma matsutake]|nr:hypothetical protein L208DRAFT_1380694 [Tricholoma matsutake 945]